MHEYSPGGEETYAVVPSIAEVHAGSRLSELA
jgi:hypothetical protein